MVSVLSKPSSDLREWKAPSDVSASTSSLASNSTPASQLLAARNLRCNPFGEKLVESWEQPEQAPGVTFTCSFKQLLSRNDL